MKYLLLIITGLLLFMQSHAQVQGSVVDAQTGEVLPGVTVQVLHADKGCRTDARGRFTLQGNTNDSVQVSFIGYQTRKLRLSSQPSPVISLSPATASLNEIIVTTSRDKQARTDAPVAISTISTQEIRDTKATSLEQLLNKVSGVYMVDLGNEQHTMAIRQPIGYKSLFLYMEDGIPIRTTGDFNHNALIEINMAALKTIEVVRGPASSLYGSEAVGGAVNFITTAPSLQPAARIQAEISDRGYKRTDFNTSATFNKLGISVGGYYADQRNGYMDHSDFHKLALTLRADYQISDRTRWINSMTLIDYYTDQVGGMDSAHFFAKDYRNFQTFSYRQVNALRYRSTLEHNWNNDNKTTVTAFFRNNSIKQNPFYALKTLADPLKAAGEINDDSFNSYGLIMQHRKKFSWKKASLIAGVSADYSPAEYYARFIDVTKDAAGYFRSYTTSDSVLTNYNVGLLNTAAYAQFDMELLYRLKFVAALRYDRMDYNFDNHLPPSAFTGAPDERNHFNKLTPKVGLTYHFGQRRGLYVNYSVGFAPPNISELYRGVKVPTLQPATYRNYEAGGWFAFANDKGYADLGVYNMLGTNEIISVKLDDGSYENRNAGRTTHRGIEWNIRYAPLPSLWIRSSGQYAEHFFNEFVEKGVSYNDNRMAGAPRVIMNTEITWKPGCLKGFRIAGEWQHVSSYYMDPRNTGTYEGYELLNFRAGYSWRQFDCWLNCRNAADVMYSTTTEKTTYNTTYRPGPKRTFNIGFGYTFNGKK
ncbi:TonB-dependent receptor [Chitinophaga rhizophila]|uniref:TonB-dependent receptor n=1 Tax=Chitinophaga rhizophila TaxID=2866212 RepID=A0ABS7GCQ0_9BACT|nr:TonB-dependent receptor [Chitinophaga rhizophila]MBW8685448.1 TonB-dependent receptor [Chitinophaga rhizophila]